MIAHSHHHALKAVPLPLAHGGKLYGEDVQLIQICSVGDKLRQIVQLAICDLHAVDITLIGNPGFVQCIQQRKVGSGGGITAPPWVRPVLRDRLLTFLLLSRGKTLPRFMAAMPFGLFV